jgi:hypothetical protein
MNHPSLESEAWENYGFDVDPEERDEFLLEVIEPIVDDLEADGSLRSFHFKRGDEERPGQRGIELRINTNIGAEHIEEIIDSHTNADYRRSDLGDPPKWIERDQSDAGEGSSDVLTVDREHHSRTVFKLLAAKRDGEDVDLAGVFVREAHTLANQLGFGFQPSSEGNYILGGFEERQPDRD